MRAVLCSQNKITKLILPENIEGSYWFLDDNEEINLININSSDNMWVISANYGVTISYNGKSVTKIQLSIHNFYVITYNGKTYVLYAEDVIDRTFVTYSLKQDTNLSIGSGSENNIVYSNGFLAQTHVVINYTQGSFKIVSPNGKIFYKNDVAITSGCSLYNGDVISIFGLRIIIMNNTIMINNPFNRVSIKCSALSARGYYVGLFQEKKDMSTEILYKDEDYFFKRPRLRRYIKTYDLELASPPPKKEEEETPLILVIGPMITMGIVSFVSLANAIVKLVNGTSTFSKSWPTLITSCAMLLTMLLWPNLTKRYQKAKAKRAEEKRVTKYRAYIAKKQQEVLNVAANQKSILEEKLLPIGDCLNIIEKKGIELWDRQNDQRDFLTVRIGRGNISLDININFSKEEFTLDEDDLKKEAEKLVNKAAVLENVPIEYALNENKATAIMGEPTKVFAFARNILFQLVTYHSYDDLKIIFLTDEKNKNQWKEFKNLPHCFSNDKETRFFASNLDEMKNIDGYLCREFIKRATAEGNREMVETEDGEVNYKPYYLIVTDDYPRVRKLGIDNLVLENKLNLGFGFLIIENKFGILPSQCLDFINLGKDMSETLKNNSEEYLVQQFKDEINDFIDYSKYFEKLANIPIEVETEGGSLPTSLSFLEMFKIGKVEQLNSLTRWKKNDPTQSLRALVGVMSDDNRIYLDLHEKAHGPHGLIAGTTGSGKSEFIITYILSMALNYSPEEVSFILIDYKGGGLAGAFENKTLNIRLPHLAGVITNLDKSELNRTLVSINSELQRRQSEFNKARDELGESTIDIYKYQKFYREGRLKKPISHLFIICDEFAELKSQQPDFMNDLISAARIGRSLGVHLILATQKPSGVVNDQIWSNTKFRVCLKVQDRGDSNEMLKKPDAAEIKNAGRFYLQVGYDEIYVLGQSGYAGIPYKPSDFVVKDDDKSVIFINNIGETVKEANFKKEKQVVNASGDQLSNVLKYVINMANKNNLKADRLWLDSIPQNIYVDKLAKKYNYDFSTKVEAVIGEYDDPVNQKQNILTLPLDGEANTLVFGRNPMDREMFLNSVIYSLCTRYRSESINMYILDFGSETLRMFSRFPQVGDVMIASDAEKVTKTFSIINELIVSRKNLFADYNGDYFIYCKNSGKQVPLVLFIINNYESFTESYAKYEDDLIRYSREGKRYGIILMITSASSHGFPSRIRRNFNNCFALELPDRSDYIDLFGKIGNLYPADFVGRGICKSDHVCEFQTANIYEGDDVITYLKEVAEKINKVCTTKAPKIPVLPDMVTMDSLLPSLGSLDNVPIGISKNTLKESFYNFKKNKLNIIASVELENMIPFLTCLVKMLTKIKNVKIVLVDLKKVMQKCIDDVTGYCDDAFSHNSASIMSFIDKNIINNKENNLLFVIVGTEKIITQANSAAMKNIVDKIENIDNANILIADSVYQLKKTMMEPWYIRNNKNDDGIYVGAGVSEQSIIRIQSTKLLNAKLGNNFAWKINNGNFELLKVMEMETNEKQNND